MGYWVTYKDLILFNKIAATTASSKGMKEKNVKWYKDLWATSAVYASFIVVGIISNSSPAFKCIVKFSDWWNRFWPITVQKVSGYALTNLYNCMLFKIGKKIEGVVISDF